MRSQPNLLVRVWQQVLSDDCIDLAAQISFFFSLSLLPFCLVFAILIGRLPSTVLWRSFATWIVTYLPIESQRLIFSTILGLVNYSAGFLSFGAITALWSASSGFVSLMESLSVVYGVRESRPYWRKHLIAICVTVLTMAFMLAMFGLVAFGHWGYGLFSDGFRDWSPYRAVWDVGRWAITLAILCVVVDIANFILPDVRRPWRWITPGTALVVLTLVASSAGFNVYVQHFASYPEVYGALGGFIILMLWIYIAVLIFLVGAETDREIEQLPSEARTG